MTKHSNSRRTFIRNSGLSASALMLLGPAAIAKSNFKLMSDSGLKISLAEWSLNKEIKAGELLNLDFAAKAREFGINGIEYVNQFFADKAEDMAYLKELNMRADDNGVEQVLIMIDSEGDMGAESSEDRLKAIDNHKKWVDAAKFLGCHAIRVNAGGPGNKEELHGRVIDGLSSLSEYAKTVDMNVLVENHGGWSSDGKWLSGVMAEINMDNCGTLPDFGNFCVRKGTGDMEGKCVEEYDKYDGVKELMVYAKAVSAKSMDFDSEGNETTIDFKKMMKIVKKAGYQGWVGIEFEGHNMSAPDGIMATKKLLEQYI